MTVQAIEMLTQIDLCKKKFFYTEIRSGLHCQRVEQPARSYNRGRDPQIQIQVGTVQDTV